MQKWLKAKLESPCAICTHTIAVGDRILPFGENDEHSFRYCHLSCAKDRNAHFTGAVKTPVCKHWRSRGLCLFGDKCVFQHPPELAAAVAQTAALRAAQVPGSNAAMRAGAPVRRKGQRLKVKNRFRAGAFRRWLIDTYGRERLREGEGVLDVAGGKGELAFELAHLNGIPATVVEPRELQLERATLRLKSGFYHWNTGFNATYNDRGWVSASVGEGSAAGASNAPTPVLNHLRLVVTSELCRQLGLSVWDAGTVSESDSDGEEGDGNEEKKHAMGCQQGSYQQSVASSTAGSTAGGTACMAGGTDAYLQLTGAEAAAAAASAAEPPMPAGWLAALRRAQLRAQHSRWTRKGLEHESAASAAAAAGGRGGGESSDEEGESPSAGGFPAPWAAACAAGSSSSANGSGGSQNATDLKVNLGNSRRKTQSHATNPGMAWAAEALEAAAAGAGEGEGEAGGLSAAQLASAGAFLECLFAQMDSAAGGAGASELQQPGAVQPQPQPQSSLHQQQPASIGAEEEGEAGEEGGLSAAQLTSAGTFLEGLFARMNSAGDGAGADGQHQLEPQCSPQQQQAARVRAEEEVEGEAGEEGGLSAAQLASAGTFLEVLFARMDSAAGGAGADGGQHSELAQPQPQSLPPQQQAASVGGEEEVGEEGGLSAAQLASAGSFLEGLFAQMDSTAGGVEADRQQQSGAGPASSGIRRQSGRSRLLTAQEGVVTHVVVDSPARTWQLLTGFSIAVGMHSDQATEFIVDLALKHNRPFAVVPCCVYASEFPRRKMGGQPVSNYQQLIEYLVAKDPERIRVAELPFQGKNKVVYCL